MIINFWLMELITASNLCNLTKTTHQGQMSSKALTTQIIKSANQQDPFKKELSGYTNNFDHCTDIQYGGTPLIISQDIINKVNELSLKGKNGQENRNQTKKISLSSNQDSSLSNDNKKLNNIIKTMRLTDKLGQYCFSKVERREYKQISNFQGLTALILKEMHMQLDESIDSSVDCSRFNIRKSKSTYQFAQSTLNSIHKNEKKLLLINLDNTIVYMEQGQNLSSSKLLKIKQFTFSIFYRPNLLSALKELSQYYFIYVFSDQDKDFTEKIVNSIDPKAKIFSGFLYCDHLCEIIEPIYKPFASNFFFELPEDLIPYSLIISYSAYAFGQYIDNGIPMLPFYGDPSDNESLSLLQYLNYLVDKKDILATNQKCVELRKNLTIEIDESEIYEHIYSVSNHIKNLKQNSQSFKLHSSCRLVNGLDNDNSDHSKKLSKDDFTSEILYSQLIDNMHISQSSNISPKCLITQNSNNYIINYNIKIINKTGSKRPSLFSKQDKPLVIRKNKRNSSCPKRRRKAISSKCMQDQMSPRSPKQCSSTSNLLNKSYYIQLFELNGYSNHASEISEQDKNL